MAFCQAAWLCEGAPSLAGAACANSEPVATQFFLPAPECAGAHFGRRSRQRARPIERGACFANADGLSSRTALAVRLLVNRALPRRCFNPKMVNWSAQEFFPVIVMLNKHFIPASIPYRRG
jgi:hypothetical protein